MNEASGEEKTQTYIIFKSHHSFGDGASGISFIISGFEEYTKEHFVVHNDVPLYLTLFIRLQALFYIPVVVI